MRTFTRLDERSAGLGPLTEHTYECAWGVGRFVLAGDLPVELCLPVASAGVPASAAAGAASAAASAASGAASAAAGAASAATGAASLAAERLRRRLERYFAGEPVRFELDMAAYAEALGLTAFETEVYAALAAVPWGTALSYRDLAAAAGHPNAYRAAGSVMARNQLPVILPCHRVVRNDGRLGQYGDDPAWKERLLALEGVAVREGRLT